MMSGIARATPTRSLCQHSRYRVVAPMPQRMARVRATTCDTVLTADAQTEMMTQQKVLLKSVKDHSKRVKKLAKQIGKVPADKKVALALEIKEMIAKLDSDNDQLLRLAMSMAEAGYEDPDADSSSEEDVADQIVAAAQGGVAQLLQLQEGQVQVCNGKACTRKGGSEQVFDALTGHFQDTPKVDVQQCSCMGMCKYAANVAIRGKDTTTIISELTPAMLPEHSIQQRELEAVA